MKRTGQAWLLGLLLAAGGLPAARAGCLAPDTRPSVGLVLSGGGARGAAHVGVLRQLEAMNVPVDCIAGTSMGAIVGGLYASGMSVDEIEQLLDRIDWADALSDQPPREDLSFRRKQDDRSYLIEAEIGFREGRIRLPRGLIQGQKQNTILKAATLPVSGIHDFDRLPIPFRAVATDIETGEGVILSQGNLAAAVQASMSVPGVFAPREIGGRLLVDGGISNNLPVSVARDMGADVIIAVDVSAPLKSRDELTSGIEVASQTVSILIHKAAMAQIALLGPEDILVKPDLGELRSGDFFNVHQAVTAGEAAALSLADEIGRLGIGQAGFDRYKADRAAARPGHPVIDNVTVVTDSRLDPEVIERRLRAAPGMPLDEATLEQDISTIYGLDTFEQVDYEIIAEGDTTGLEVRATAKSWGPAFLDFGLNLEEDFEGSSNYNFAARFTRAELNRLGGEWRIDAQLGQRARFFTEFYQPLDTGTRYFIAPQVEFSRANVSVFESDRRTAEYRVSTTGAGLDLGRNLGNSAEFRVGLRRAAGRAVRRIGESGPERSDFDSGGWFTSLSFDTLDNPDFPRTGHIGGVSWQAERESLGAGLNSDVLRLDWLGAKSFGRNTVLGSLRIASALDDELALQDTFTLGGLFQLSGYDTDQLAGRQLGLATLVLYRKLASVGAGALELPLYFGGALEAGNVWQNRDEASFGDLRYGGNLFVGIDTPLGPLYLAIGLSEGGDQAGYFYLGQTFYGVTP